jgi:hypothetical protein
VPIIRRVEPILALVTALPDPLAKLNTVKVSYVSFVKAVDPERSKSVGGEGATFIYRSMKLIQ